MSEAGNGGGWVVSVGYSLMYLLKRRKITKTGFVGFVISSGYRLCLSIIQMNELLETLRVKKNVTTIGNDQSIVKTH